MPMRYEESFALDFDARALAEATGIARGWSQNHLKVNERGGTVYQVFVTACNICGCASAEVWTSTSPFDENQTEERCDRRFLTDSDCPHWEDYENQKGSPSVRARALGMAMDRGGDAT